MSNAKGIKLHTQKQQNTVVYDSYVQPIPPAQQTLYINTQNMNLRDGPGPEHGKMTIIPFGTRVIAIETAVSNNGKNWVKVQIGNFQGWLNRQYLSTTAPSATIAQSTSDSFQGRCTFLPAAGFSGKIVNDHCTITKIDNDSYQLRWSNQRQTNITLSPATIDGNNGRLIKRKATAATVSTTNGRIGFCWNCKH